MEAVSSIRFNSIVYSKNSHSKGTKMSSQLFHQDLIRRYTDQPAIMPVDLRQKIENLWGGRPVQLYALSDLDEEFRFSKKWIALGPEHIAIATHEKGTTESIQCFDR